jgi:hypothetical protein
LGSNPFRADANVAVRTWFGLISIGRTILVAARLGCQPAQSSYSSKRATRTAGGFRRYTPVATFSIEPSRA